MQLGLGVVQIGVDAVALHQILVGALLLDFTVADDQNPGGAADGGQAVGDD